MLTTALNDASAAGMALGQAMARYPFEIQDTAALEEKETETEKHECVMTVRMILEQEPERILPADKRSRLSIALSTRTAMEHFRALNETLRSRLLTDQAAAVPPLDSSVFGTPIPTSRCLRAILHLCCEIYTGFVHLLNEWNFMESFSSRQRRHYCATLIHLPALASVVEMSSLTVKVYVMIAAAGGEGVSGGESVVKSLLKNLQSFAACVVVPEGAHRKPYDKALKQMVEGTQQKKGVATWLARAR
jgi:hypothetical protein